MKTAQDFTAPGTLDDRGYTPRTTPAPWRQWGDVHVEDATIRQMENACLLPGAVRGALMPDAHTGYGLPIGGVLAMKGAVIPYAVGVDIACRMRLSVLDLPVSSLLSRREILVTALEKETRFGMGAGFEPGERREHAIMDDTWDVTRITQTNKDKAWKQLGSSGGGNHFVEFGELHLDAAAEIGNRRMEKGVYLALLSHSGSRGTGETVVVHRKGATPAGAGAQGIVPGSMGAPGFVVRGRGNEAALNSCSHGAGRLMSRTAAMKTLGQAEVLASLRERGVELLSGGLDEAPMAYKDIHAVMAAQDDLVEILARFEPRLVKMAPDDAGGWMRKKKKRR